MKTRMNPVLPAAPKMASEKQYGLVHLPKKGSAPAAPSKPKQVSVFGNDSDSDEGGPTSEDWVKQSLKKSTHQSLQQRQAKQAMKKALAEDPSVYQYDEIYDEMQESRRDAHKKKDTQEKKPKYIESILAAAAVRKREQEWRTERKMQKEREKEGDEFDDKEAFVTTAYRKKMEEFQQMAEEEKKQAEVEAILDVSKQKDLAGFYRHIFRQTMGEEVTKPTASGTSAAEDPVEVKVEKEEEEESKEAKEEESEGGVEAARKAAHRMRQYRKRESSSESEEEEVVAASEEEEGDDAKKRRHDSDSEGEEETLPPSKSPKRQASTSEVEVKIEVKVDKAEEVKEIKEPRRNVWAKRTVGDALEAAKDRFWARKAAREDDPVLNSIF